MIILFLGSGIDGDLYYDNHHQTAITEFIFPHALWAESNFEKTYTAVCREKINIIVSMLKSKCPDSFLSTFCAYGHMMGISS